MHRPDRAGRRAALPCLTILVAFAGCASLPGADAMSETLHSDPPYRAGRLPDAPPQRIAVTPVTFQVGEDGPAFAPSAGRGTPVARVLDRVDAWLADQTHLKPLDAPPTGDPPDVRFGCRTDATGDCEPFVEMMNEGPPLVLGVRRPNVEWEVSARTTMATEMTDALLVVTLEIGQYWPRQLDWRGRKGVDLGTNHRQDLPWLTSLDDPVQVLQLTAALVDRDGVVVRIGAEGLIARRSRLTVSAIGGQELLSDEDVDALLAARREDLPGDPPVLETALADLVAGVTGLGW